MSQWRYGIGIMALHMYGIVYDRVRWDVDCLS